MASTYAYLLGLYLGDGHVANAASNPFLAIYLDQAYPGVVGECKRSLIATFPRVNVGVRRRRGTGAIIVQLSSVELLAAFPQHGPGKKHERKIELEPWQRDITHRYPKQFLRGLIHSDGSRCINSFEVDLPRGGRRRYSYPRYFFTNYSAHIRGLFCEHCELVGVRWTQSNARNISVSDRRSVALMDGFIGPKA